MEKEKKHSFFFQLFLFPLSTVIFNYYANHFETGKSELGSRQNPVSSGGSLYIIDSWYVSSPFCIIL